MTQHGDPSRLPEPGLEGQRLWIGAGVVLLILLMIFGAVILAAFAGGGAMPDGPFMYLAGLTDGTSSWSTLSTITLVVILLFCGLVAIGVGWLLLKASGQRNRVDHKARSLATLKAMRPLTEEAAVADAERLAVPASVGKGLSLGDHVSGGGTYTPLWSSYEWVQVWILGPRAGKTSCVAVRQIVEHHGPVLATSNKRDIVDLTRLPRLELGHCWVFDPQKLIGEEPTWWWDPLSYVTGVEQADELAGVFASSMVSAQSTEDAYFEPEARTHLSNLLLAAAVSGQPISRVWDWLTEPNDPEPAEVLYTAGFTVPADGISKISGLADGQRDGVVGTARKMCSWLRNPDTLRWITRSGPTDGRPHFDPAEFIRTRQTLYLISREGAGSARAVTAALAVATMRAAEKLAGHSPRGRLAIPMAVVLDEAANVVRWRDLPDMYSHFGSRGINVSTFFQSWSQGKQAFGEDGMNKLWSASNVRVVGSGVAEAGFLQELSNLVGDHDRVSVDTSVSPRSGREWFAGRTTVSRRLRREKIFEVSELQSLPPGRAILLTAGFPAALLKLRHYSETSYADQVRQSEAAFTEAPSGMPLPESTRTAAGARR